LLPDILTTLGIFKQFVVWKKDKPYPKPGLIENYDELEIQRSNIEHELNLELNNIKKALNCTDICYVNIKEKYEVEIPERKNMKIPK
jgi:hypothetical protein